jgi:maltooligosyltrehalose trehalohydrolase
MSQQMISVPLSRLLPGKRNPRRVKPAREAHRRLVALIRAHGLLHPLVVRPCDGKRGHRGRKHGAPPDPDLAGDRFVIAIQNHDQVGNRAFGDRLNVFLNHPPKRRLAACLLLLAPHLPLLFMGEEYGEPRPFPFFCSFGSPELVQAVRAGRRSEFEDFMREHETIPDPQAVETFDSAKLTWSWPEGSVSAGLRRLYADLLAARKRWPAMRDFETRAARLCGQRESGGPVLELLRGREGAEHLRASFNLNDAPAPLPTRIAAGETVLFASESPRYGGRRGDGNDATTLLPFECIVIGRQITSTRRRTFVGSASADRLLLHKVSQTPSDRFARDARSAM